MRLPCCQNCPKYWSGKEQRKGGRRVRHVQLKDAAAGSGTLRQLCCYWAFYDALAQNESAVEVMGNDQLRVIAHELVEQPEKQRFGGLAAPGVGAGTHANSCQTHPPQARLSAGPSGRRRADRPTTGRGALGAVGGVMGTASTVGLHLQDCIAPFCGGGWYSRFVTFLFEFLAEMGKMYTQYVTFLRYVLTNR